MLCSHRSPTSAQRASGRGSREARSNRSPGGNPHTWRTHCLEQPEQSTDSISISITEEFVRPVPSLTSSAAEKRFREGRKAACCSFSLREWVAIARRLRGGRMRERSSMLAGALPHPSSIRTIHGAHPSGRLRRSRAFQRTQSRHLLPKGEGIAMHLRVTARAPHMDVQVPRAVGSRHPAFANTCASMHVAGMRKSGRHSHVPVHRRSCASCARGIRTSLCIKKNPPTERGDRAGSW